MRIALKAGRTALALLGGAPPRALFPHPSRLSVRAPVRLESECSLGAGERLRAEERSRLLVESMPHALVIADERGFITEVNAQTLSWFGYPREALIGRPVELLVPERLREPHAAHRETYLRDARMRPMGTGLALFARRRDSSEFPVDISLSPIRTERGVEVIAAIQDITDRKRAEEAARISEHRYRELLETLPVGVLIHRDYSPLFVNEAFARMLGYESREAFLDAARSAGPGFYIPEGERAQRLESHRRRMAGEPLPTPIQRRAIARDGRDLWLQTWHHVATWQGEPAMESIHIDITGRMNMEQELRRSEARFRRIFDEGPIPMALVDPALRFERVNARLCEMLGYSRKELEAMDVTEVTHPEDRERERELVKRMFAGGSPAVQVEKRYVTRDGAVRHAELTRSLIRDGTGARPCAIAMILDISARKQAEQELKAANEALAALNHELESFAYSVSHDLRQPLRAMTGFSRALLEDHHDRLDAEGRDYLMRIEKAVKRMSRLIDDLLTLSGISRVEIAREPVDLSGLAREIAAELQQFDPHRHAEFRIARDMMANADPRLLRIALQNLIGNAWKFTARADRARIEVGAEPSPERDSFFVRDNGVGFEMAYVHKLFAPFQRLHAENEFPGTGIGLATVKRIMARHGGRVWAESSPGAGTTFHFTL